MTAKPKPTQTYSFYASLVRPGQPDEHYVLPNATTASQAMEAALELLKGYGPKEARLEVYQRPKDHIFPLLVGLRLS